MNTLLEWITAVGIGAIIGGFLTHTLATVAREAERDYERAFEGYSRLLALTRNLLVSNIQEAGKTGVEELVREIDRAWLYGSDGVIRIANEITNRARPANSGTQQGDERLFGKFVMEMRTDLQQKRSFRYKFWPWGKTSLKGNDYRLAGPGPRFNT